ncbi:hypothetical protein D3C77_554990 [compost metagenome]
MGDAPELFLALTHQGQTLLAVVDVASNGQGAAAKAAHLVGNPLDVLGASRTADHIGAGFGIRQGNGATDTATTAGDNGNTAGQLKALQDTHGLFSRWTMTGVFPAPRAGGIVSTD